MATIKDVAQKAGVTVTTVSRVMNNRGYLSEKTKQKVALAMQELDYHPNEIARSLFQKQTSFIGVIVPSLLHPYYCECINYLEQYAALNNLKLLVCNAQRNVQKELEYIEMLKANQVSGIILATHSHTLVSQLQKLPVVTLEQSISNNIPAILIDNYKGGTLATEHLIASGCKILAMISSSRSNEERAKAFVNCCEKANVPYRVYSSSPGQFNQLSYHNLINTILDQNPAVEGIFASSDIIAAQVIQASAQKGRIVGKDLKLVGFDDIQLAGMLSPSLTTIHQPIKELCEAAIQALLSPPLQKKTVFDVSLVKRQSC
jgi:LacI family sucrose operon transcriptional repressor